MGASACAGPAWNCRFCCWRRWRCSICLASSLRLGRLHQEEEAHRLGVDAVHQFVEQRECFLLELDQRILLPVAAQPDSLLQVVEREQVVFPLRVHDIQQDVAFEPAQRRRAEKSFFLLVARLHFF